jgi:hypothetical protein
MSWILIVMLSTGLTMYGPYASERPCLRELRTHAGHSKICMPLMVGRRLHKCASACPILWFSGRHAEIQIRSRLTFHMPYVSRTGQASPEAIEEIVAYLQTVGLTERQARFLMTAAPPSGEWMITVPVGYALGFNPQIISSLWGWNSCTAKFCLAVP